jgi:hypothetical protein
MIPQVHYLAPRRPLPSCSDAGGAITPKVTEVTCPDCRGALPFALADFRRAYLALAWAVAGRVLARRAR